MMRLRDVARAARDAGHGAGFVEFDQRLGKVEIDRAALVALVLQDFGQFAHELEAFHQRRVAGSLRGVAFEQQMHVRVGHALGAANHAPAELEAQRLAVPVELDQRGHDEPVGLRDQGTDVGRELERQHRDGAVGEVDAGAAQARFAIDRAAGRDVMAHIGNVDLQRVVAVRQFVHQDRIVEIARRFAVDGHDRQVAEIASAFEIAPR